jgi:hypothetical protein
MPFAVQPDPKFAAKVRVHVPGEKKPYEFEAMFKYKTKQQLDEFIQWSKDKTDSEVILEIVDSWKLQGFELDTDGVESLCQRYHTAATRIVNTYVDELTGARLGN